MIAITAVTDHESVKCNMCTQTATASELKVGHRFTSVLYYMLYFSMNCDPNSEDVKTMSMPTSVNRDPKVHITIT